MASGLKFAIAVVVGAALLGVHAAASAEVSVPGFTVTTYATVTDPTTLSFDPAGNLYVGRDNSGSSTAGDASSHAVRIHRIGPGGSPVVEYGASAITDPDAVAFDGAGVISGVPGSVLVGGVAPSGGGQISAIRPDGSVVVRFGPTSAFINPVTLLFDRAGRMLFADAGDGVGPGIVLASTGGTPATLFTIPTDPIYLAIDPSDRIVTSDRNGVIRIHAANGTLINDAFATGLPSSTPIAFGRGGAFGTDLYAVDNVNGTLVRFSGDGVRTVVGTGFGTTVGAVQDIVFGADGALYAAMFFEDRIVRIVPPRSRFDVDLVCPPTVPRGMPVQATLRVTNETSESRTLTRAAVGVHAGEMSVAGPRAQVFNRALPIGAVVEEPIGIVVPRGTRAGAMVTIGLAAFGTVGADPKRRPFGTAGCIVEVVR